MDHAGRVNRGPGSLETLALAGVAASNFCLAACVCHGMPSCVPTTAIVVTVTSGTDGGPVQGVAIEVSGPAYYGPRTTCEVGTSATVCTLLGDGGTYNLLVTAPGYTAVARNVSVKSHEVRCSCADVDTERISLRLSRTP